MEVKTGDILLSVLVPAYNASEYISACLNSVFSQVDLRVEVVVVDDGSTDDTLRVIFSEFEQHIELRRLVVISQVNAGPGAARNRALERCCGRYITFLDSDDLLLKNYFREIAPLLEQDSYDIVEHGFIRFSGEDALSLQSYERLYGYAGAYALSTIRSEVFARTVWYPSIRIFRNALWSDIRYPEGVFYEDPMTIHKIFLRDCAIFFTDRPFLGYRLNPKGVTSQHSSPHMLDLVRFYESLTGSCLPIHILKVRLARTILYFHHELGTNKEAVSRVLGSLDDVPKGFGMWRHLKLVDLVFLLFTRAYIALDRTRFRLRSYSGLRKNP